MLKSSFFKNNRRKLLKNFKKGELFILIEDIVFSKRDSVFFNVFDTNLFYLTGIEQENTKIILYKNKKGEIQEYLFILKNDIKLELWEGKKITLRDSKKISGIRDVKHLEEFEEILKELLKETQHISTIYDNRNIRKNYEQEMLINKLKRKYKLKFINRFDEISKLRNVKNKCELECMKKASEVTNIGFRDVLKNLKKTKNEVEVEAQLSYVYSKNFCKHSYHPIVASGIDSCTLHYIQNNKKLKKGELLLIDSGAEHKNYKIDVTRTFPISGKFSKRQKEVYQAVLDIQKFAINKLKIGITPREWEREIVLFVMRKIKDLGLSKNLEISLENKKSVDEFRNLYPHSTGHFLGLDTHDYGNYNEQFKENQVMTVEPGIYIKKEKIGIRIEDNVLIKKKRNVILTKKIPKEIDEIEHFNV